MQPSLVAACMQKHSAALPVTRTVTVIADPTYNFMGSCTPVAGVYVVNDGGSFDLHIVANDSFCIDPDLGIGISGNCTPNGDGTFAGGATNETLHLTNIHGNCVVEMRWGMA
jgi:hypothetical protein